MSRTTRFNRLYESHHQQVLAYCLRRTSAPDAHDATSEVFSVAWRHIDTLPSEDKQLPWLYGVARNVVWRQHRSRGRLRRLVDRVGKEPAREILDPATVVQQNDERQRVLDAAARLKLADREILQLAAWEGLAHGEIADILEISVAAVDQRLHRAKKRLAAMYESTPLAGPSRASGEATT